MEELERRKKDAEEANNDLQELADLVRTKDEEIKVLQNRLVKAKRTISALKSEIQELCSSRPSSEQEQNHDQQRQRPPGSNRVSSHSLHSIHQHYEKVLQAIQDHNCSMANVFPLASCPRSTLRDFVAIGELKIVDEREHDLVIRDMQGGSVKELEAVCRKCLRRYIPVMANMRREGRLLPLKFDERFYE